MKIEMKKCIVFSICLFGASSIFAQSKQDTLFYDKNWKGVESNHLPLIIAFLAEMQIQILVSDSVIIMLRENCNQKEVTLVQTNMTIQNL